ncbi:hypothetical protein KJ359_000644 [Pestalotiopsis sp. 9143b]|nr:hypothetical protein KJ359_000644 [Pestalotiopsis sp. 9143b]
MLLDQADRVHQCTLDKSGLQALNTLTLGLSTSNPGLNFLPLASVSFSVENHPQAPLRKLDVRPNPEAEALVIDEEASVGGSDSDGLAKRTAAPTKNAFSV